MDITKLKKSSRCGFTLAETMIAVLIIVLVTGVVAAGMPTARTAYEKVVNSANAQVLLSTTVTMLRDELSHADPKTIAVSTGQVTFYSTVSGYRTLLVASPNTGTWGDDAPSTICLDYVSSDDTFDKHFSLVTRSASTGLHTTFSSVRYANGIFTIRNLQVLDRNGVVLADLDELTIRAGI